MGMNISLVHYTYLLYYLQCKVKGDINILLNLNIHHQAVKVIAELQSHLEE